MPTVKTLSRIPGEQRLRRVAAGLAREHPVAAQPISPRGGGENDFPAATAFIRGAHARGFGRPWSIARARARLQILAARYFSDVRCVFSAPLIALRYAAPPATEIKCMLDLATCSPTLAWTICRRPRTDIRYSSGCSARSSTFTNDECNGTVSWHDFNVRPSVPPRAAQHRDPRSAERAVGACDMTAFPRLAQIVKRGTRANRLRRDGKAYEGGASSPLTATLPPSTANPNQFVSGELNQCYLPVSTKRTFQWLRSVNDPALYRRHVTPGYGHIDNFMGATAIAIVTRCSWSKLEACPGLGAGHFIRRVGAARPHGQAPA